MESLPKAGQYSLIKPAYLSHATPPKGWKVCSID